MTDRPKRDPNGRVIDLAKLDPAEARDLHDAFVEAFDALGDEPGQDDGVRGGRFEDMDPAKAAQVLAALDGEHWHISDEVIAEVERCNRLAEKARSSRRRIHVEVPVLDKGEDFDPVRTAARHEALTRFAGRPGLRAYMSDEQIRRVEEYDGPVVLGQPVLRVGNRVIEPLVVTGVVSRKSKDVSPEELASFGLILNPDAKQEK